MKKHVLRAIAVRWMYKRMNWKALGAVAAAGIICLVAMGGFVIWAASATFRHAAEFARVHLPPAVAKDSPMVSRAEASLAGPLLKPGCLAHARGLVNLRTWLEEPIVPQLRNLQLACLASNPEPKPQEETSEPNEQKRSTI